MSLADDHARTAPPSRRGVLRAVAWTAPAITLAAASPAFAGSGTQPVVAAKSSLFWRPEGAEIPSGETFYWGFIPAGSLMWITQLTNPGPAVVENVQLNLAVPADATANKEFTVLDASKLAVSPAVFATTQRAADGRLVVTLPQLPAGAAHTVTVAIKPPDSVPRGSTPSWPLTVTPPAGGTTISVPITSYAQFIASTKA
ncbi:hypothetical protein [Nocardioides daphniae]|uniref:DUF916 domain-containing protein n=1 Tax=Nocardioides daphniae TaxID=402297 RepID=A0A4P7UBT7_9ACTN|nr:hypothetical protein [Nocardioides daphniae]QCC76419.1 hypothetical protein E2C04_02880 [Nocardioides daphniae]GGD06937.1 hypothetical protein GCM10007231_02120 [Nocardioides daphniae]